MLLPFDGLTSLEATPSGLPSDLCTVLQGKALQISTRFWLCNYHLFLICNCMEWGSPKVVRKNFEFPDGETWVLVLSMANSLTYLELSFPESNSQ